VVSNSTVWTAWVRRCSASASRRAFSKVAKTSLIAASCCWEAPAACSAPLAICAIDLSSSCAAAAASAKPWTKPHGKFNSTLPLELWFQDEARIGQKNKVTRRWAERGTRPFALKDQRTASAYIFGAICPALGKAAGLVLPPCNTEAMTLHLQEIALAVEPGAHAVLFVDRAGWHVTAKLDVPENMTLVSLPSKSPELNPVENIWQYMRNSWLSNRIFANYDDILDHCCFNWNKLVERPWLIISIGTRRWAHRSDF
jgi:transposase